MNQTGGKWFIGKACFKHDMSVFATVFARKSCEERENEELSGNARCSHSVREKEKWLTKNLRKSLIISVDQPGLEPGTSRLWVCCSNQLSYKSEDCGAKIHKTFELSFSSSIFFSFLTNSFRWECYEMVANDSNYWNYS